ncbi:hypothetical protein GCM10009827_090770 [Dactylosporangium maewongense]|uniref:Uncharacterized protein n=1 Tax=Dactylosporangium maewongense TaxID=634393 RepID=A0ABN2CGC5_9ACTN
MLSARAKRFLAEHATRHPPMPEGAIRAAAGDLPGDAVEALVRFEASYGGLWYRVIGGNPMEHGLDGEVEVHDTPLGPAFTGILDGAWTWPVDVLLDGRTALDLGSWPFRVIDRSVEQRIEKHALLVEVKGWPHRTYTCRTPPRVAPVADERLLPPAVPEASGPADLWWRDDDTAVEATLHAWGGGQDLWTVRHFGRVLHLAHHADPIVYAAMGHETVPATWCILCSEPVAPERMCPPPPASPQTSGGRLRRRAGG